MILNGDIIDLEAQRVINIHEEEITFFKKFLKERNIPWNKDDQMLNILPLSRSYAGYIKTPLRKIELPPKFKELSIEHVIRLYNYVFAYQDDSDDELLGVKESEKSLEAKFLKDLREQLSLGLLQEYKINEKQSEYLTGKVDYKTTYINSKLLKNTPVISEAFELSLNVDINRLICGALTIISSSKSYSSDSIELLNYFHDVKPCLDRGNELLSKIVFNSKTNRYKKVAIEAAMIIDSFYFDDVRGETGGESFLINFDILFEMFVRKVLFKNSTSREFGSWKIPKVFAELRQGNDVIGSRNYLPDVLYNYREEDARHGFNPSAEAVLDVKNKAYSLFKNADLYQIVFYNQMLFAKKSILIYPSFVEKSPIRLDFYNETIDPPSVYAVFINIRPVEPSEFKYSLQYFINSIYDVLELQS